MIAHVRIVRCTATPSPAVRDILAKTLTPDERDKRARFVRAIDADRFLVGRGTLRIEVGRMLGIAPRDVAIEYGDHDKPLVVGGLPHVNVSHAGDVVLVALTRDTAIGVDVERIDDRFVEPGIIELSFSSQEIRDLAQLPEALRVSAFFHVWACREAVIKAVGAGFSMPRESFDVRVDPRLPPLVTATHAPLPAFHLQSIAVAAGHVAMLATVDAAAVDITLVDNPQYDGV